MADLKPAFAAILTLALWPGNALATEQRTLTLNQNAVGLLAGETQWLPQSIAIAAALQHEDGMRVLPIAGSGGLQAVNDLVHLQSVDAALISSDVVAYAQSQGLLDGFDGKIGYIAKIAPLNVILVAQRSIANITELAGRRIATGPANSATFATGELIFGALEIPFARVPRQGEAGLLALKRGQAEAALFVGADFSESGLDPAKFHILALPLPTSLGNVYAPALLTKDSAPGLIGANQSIETVSASLAIAVFNWPRNSEHFYKLRKFSKALFTAGAALTEAEGSTNLSAEIMGWTRHSSADEVLQSLKAAGGMPAQPTPQQGDGP